MAQIRVRNSSLIREKRDPKNDNGPPMTGPQRRKNPVTDDNTKHIKNKLPKNLRYDLENALLGVSVSCKILFIFVHFRFLYCAPNVRSFFPSCQG